MKLYDQVGVDEAVRRRRLERQREDVAYIAERGSAWLLAVCAGAMMSSVVAGLLMRLLGGM